MFASLSFRDTPRRAGALAGLLLVVQLAVIGVVYKHGVAFNCLENWPRPACAFGSGTLISVYAMLAALGMLFTLDPAPLRRLTAQAGHSLMPLVLNAAGFAIAMIPVLLLENGTGRTMLVPVMALWAIGFTLLLAGLMWFIAPVARWRALIAEQGWSLALVTVAGLLAPLIAIEIRPFWNRLDLTAAMTFAAVEWLTATLGYAVVANPAERIIGAGDFFIDIAPVCSGIEGIALVTIFVTLFLVLFRAELRFPRALWLYPAGILVSALLNIVRITVLLIIGLEGNPELAVGGFHSHAGWVMFTLIAVGVVIVGSSLPALRRAPPAAVEMRALPPLLRDPVVARLLPFAIFMFSALLAQAFSQTPGVVYPLRALAMLAVLALFWPIYRGLEWSVSRPALVAGALVGLGWVLVPYETDETARAYADLAGPWLVGWMLARGIGTILLVPVIEELFFRDYLEGRLRALGGPVVAALITAGLFAVLHDRWAEAFLAGLVFSWVMARHGRVADAIVAHGVANAIVFAVALATGRMHII